MPQKSRAENNSAFNDESSEKAAPVRCIHFSQLVRWPGLAGSFTTLTTTKPEVPQLNSANVCYVDSIFLYRGEFCINGRFWMPKTAGAILTWEF
jgi:hypothetical protein